mmetsp:Transcript_126741/g.405236  ORF Transcript_126741/g.405236 Transcript_126741/m.405236 type:complete len:635 (-) Transcript_126741:70-1974(-)
MRQAQRTDSRVAGAGPDLASEQPLSIHQEAGTPLMIHARQLHQTTADQRCPCVISATGMKLPQLHVRLPAPGRLGGSRLNEALRLCLRLRLRAGAAHESHPAPAELAQVGVGALHGDDHPGPSPNPEHRPRPRWPCPGRRRRRRAVRRGAFADGSGHDGLACRLPEDGVRVVEDLMDVGLKFRDAANGRLCPSELRLALALLKARHCSLQCSRCQHPLATLVVQHPNPEEDVWKGLCRHLGAGCQVMQMRQVRIDWVGSPIEIGQTTTLVEDLRRQTEGELGGCQLPTLVPATLEGEGLQRQADCALPRRRARSELSRSEQCNLGSLHRILRPVHPVLPQRVYGQQFRGHNMCVGLRRGGALPWALEIRIQFQQAWRRQPRSPFCAHACIECLQAAPHRCGGPDGRVLSLQGHLRDEVFKTSGRTVGAYRILQQHSGHHVQASYGAASGQLHGVRQCRLPAAASEKGRGQGDADEAAQREHKPRHEAQCFHAEARGPGARSSALDEAAMVAGEEEGPGKPCEVQRLTLHQGHGLLQVAQTLVVALLEHREPAEAEERLVAGLVPRDQIFENTLAVPPLLLKFGQHDELFPGPPVISPIQQLCIPQACQRWWRRPLWHLGHFSDPHPARHGGQSK